MEVKTAKLSQIEKQSDSGRRLVEYFVVVSSVDRKDNEDVDTSFSEWKTEEDQEHYGSYLPKITARYPLVDHPDNPLHENVSFFCHPSGGIRVTKEPHMPKVSSIFLLDSAVRLL